MEDYKRPHVPKPPWTLTHHCWSFPKPCHCCSNVLSIHPLKQSCHSATLVYTALEQVLVREWNFPVEYSIKIMISL